MAKQKISLNPNPTFKATAHIPVPGDGTAPVEFIYRYHDRDQLQDFSKQINKLEDVDLILEMASGWDLEEPFDRENVEKLVKKFVGAPIAVLDRYMQESTGVRVKN